MNIKELLNSGINVLKINKIKNPSLDVELILSNVLKKKREYLILNENNKIRKQDERKFFRFVNRRKKGEPVSYITRKKNFWNSSFFINQNVLIPRPDSEHLVEQVLKLTTTSSSKSILDIGTGSGCLLLSILKERKLFTGYGVDISKKSIYVSKINAKRLNLTNRTKFFTSNIDKFFFGKYDIIISNPPYINNAKLKYLDKDIYMFEPRMALDGGVDGFSETIKIVSKTKELLKRNGFFILEIGFRQKDRVIKLLKRKGFYAKNVIKDYAGNDRCIVSYKI